MQPVKVLFSCFGHLLIVLKGGKTAGKLFPQPLKMFASLKEAAINIS